MKLTKAQRILLEEIQANGTVLKNGRVRRTALALRDAGLITVDWWPVPHAFGAPSERWELTLKQ